MLITYAIAKYYANNSDSGNGSGSGMIKMVKAFHVDRQAGSHHALG